MFPKLRKRSPQGSSESASDKEDDEATDYVFRIIYPGTQAEFGECRGSVLGGLSAVHEQAGVQHWQAHGAPCQEVVPGQGALRVAMLPLITYGLGCICFNLSLAGESFTAAAQEAPRRKSLHIISVVRCALVTFLGGHCSPSQASRADSSLAIPRPAQQALH